MRIKLQRPIISIVLTLRAYLLNEKKNKQTKMEINKNQIHKNTATPRPVFSPSQLPNLVEHTIE